MARIFFGLSIFAVSTLLVQIVLGLMIGDYNGLAREYLALRVSVRADDVTDEESAELARIEPLFHKAQTTKNVHFLVGVFFSASDIAG